MCLLCDIYSYYHFCVRLQTVFYTRMLLSMPYKCLNVLYEHVHHFYELFRFPSRSITTKPMQLKWRQRGPISACEIWRNRATMHHMPSSLLPLLISARQSSLSCLQCSQLSTLPTLRGDIALPPNLILLPDGEEFLLHDSKGDEDRMTVFGTLSNINLLCRVGIGMSMGHLKAVHQSSVSCVQFT